MTKIFLIVFGILTAITIYMTVAGTGFESLSSVEKSIREGSVGHARHHGGHRWGK